ncbi:MAG: 1-acyl-sn-glycerol-3-phosphate acyltransferase [Ruminococcaceae bacterium]|nr:1-acyl-sn-glycerol-3-phosphate acyltransferase [Oscillospiraceae bacterium]
MLYTVLRAIVKPIVYLLFNIKFAGLENIRDKGGFVLCSNHRTLLDPVFILVGIKKRKLRFMAKQELFKNKLLAAFFKSVGAFPVNRGKGDMVAVKKAEEIVERNHILLIFPEGTRSKTGRLLRFKSGAAHIASDAGADIVPAAICYDGRLAFRKKITVCFGQPIKHEDIKLGENTRIEDSRKVSLLVKEKVAELLMANISAASKKACDKEDAE